MDINLLDLLKSQMGQAVIKQAASFLGESDRNTESAIDGIFPSLIGGLMSNTKTTEGAEGLFNMLNDGGHDGSIFDSIGTLFGGGRKSSGLVDLGIPILRSIFGDKVGAVVDIIASVSGMKTSSSSSLLSMAAPFVMGLLGKQVKDLGLDVSGLTSLLAGQSEYVKNAAPAGLDSLLGLGLGSADKSGFTTSVHETVKASTEKVTEEASKGGASFLRWLLPLLLLIGAGWFLFNKFGGETAENFKDKTTNIVDRTGDKMRQAGDKIKETGGNIADKTSNAINKTGDKIKEVGGKVADKTGDAANAVKEGLMSVSLPGGQSISLTKGSLEEKMATYLGSDDKNYAAQAFTFNNLQFAEGGAKLTPESEKSLATLIQVLNAYPTVNIALEGHTDNTGDAAKNRVLSKQRADAVKAQLVAKGVNASRVATRGFGDAKAIAPNDTEEGRAKNRRIELKITKR